MKPLISVVTASWNQGQYIEECIGSVMGLEEGLVEHIIIDNCSDDETADVMGKFPHLRTLVEKDRGQSDALNKGFAMAEGEWILWLNSDDYMLPGVLQKFVDTVKANPQIGAVYGHMVFVDGEGGVVRTVYQPAWEYRMIYFGRFCLPSTGTLYRASLLKENPLDEDFHMVMDTEWTLRCGRDLESKRLRLPAVAFRVTEDNKTSASITTGELTPRHAEERIKLGATYHYYGHRPEESPLKGMRRLMRNAVSRAIRVKVLADKAISRLLDRSS